VQEAFRDLGVAVPRDTDMQRDMIGAATAIADMADFRRNDLIYLPGHVMIHAGEGAVVHAFGGAMTARRDDLATLMQTLGWNLGEFVVRRPG
jgi:cell wall-associated NlpC family hydrolase